MRTSVLVVLIAALLPQAILSAPGKAPEFRAKSSSYYRGYLLGRERYTQVTVQGKLSEKGGTGQLSLDPNRQTLSGGGEVVGTTLLALGTYEVKFVPAEPDGKGPPIYRLEGKGLPEKLLLVVPKEAGRPCRLMIADVKGHPARVILLER